MPYDVFISYASSDLKYAEVVYQKLDSQNFKIWFDKKRLEPGFEWHREIEQGCENSRVVLPILTPRWKNSEWTKFETYGAEAVIPLVFDGEWNDISTPPLERFQAEQFDYSRKEEKNWERLFYAINRILSEPIPLKSNKIIHLHYRPNEYFIGREKELIQIHEELHCNPIASLTQGRIRVITANGGVGKTTLARHYAAKFWRCYTQIFWVDSRLGYENEYAHIYDLLPQKEFKSKLNEIEKAKLALNEFNKNDERLLIIDNADNEDSVMEWIPKTGGCHIIVTSRFSSWSAAVKTLPLWLLEKKPSIEFLQKRTNKQVSGKELEDCSLLATKLGFLPLALEQAAAYIAKQGEGFSFLDYMERFAEAEKEFLALKTSGGSTDYPDALFFTWKTSIKKLPNGAKAIFRLCSFLDSTPIPLEMFLKNTQLLTNCIKFIDNESENNEEKANEKQPTKFQIWQWKDALADYSLISLNNKDSFKIHSLVQAVERLSLDTNEYTFWGQSIVNVIKNFVPANSSRPDSWQIWRLILSHVELLWSQFESDPNIIFDVSILDNLAWYFHGKGLYSRGIPYAQKLVKFYIDRGQEKDSEFLEVLHLLGYFYERLEEFDKAEPIFRKELKGWEEKEGLEGYNTIRATNRLAALLGLKKQFKESEILFLRVIEIREKLFGINNVDTLLSINDLGWMLERQNLRDKAEIYFRKALNGFKEYGLIDKDPDTFAAIEHNLALNLQSKGELDEAEGLWKDAVEITLKRYGAVHERTELLTSCYSDILKQKGVVDKILELKFQILMKKDDDPEFEKVEQFAVDLNNLGLEYRKIGRIDRAELLVRKALSVDIKLRGSLHPKIAHRLNNLSSILIMNTQYAEAKQNLLRAWKLKTNRHDITSIRILFIRLTISFLEDEPTELFIGQLKTLLRMNTLPDYADVASTWSIIYCIENIRSNLPEGIADFLTVLAEVTNDNSLINKLDIYEIWNKQENISLDESWK